jgi:HSP20 family protein
MSGIRELGESIGNAVVESVGRAVSKAQERRPLPVDLLESEDAYLAVFDAPGATASDVQVRFEDAEIIVRLDRFREFREGFEMRFPGRGLALDGRLELPTDAAVAVSEATATLNDNGTLAVRIPKREPELDTADSGTPVDVSAEIDEQDDHADDSSSV